MPEVFQSSVAVVGKVFFLKMEPDPGGDVGY